MPPAYNIPNECNTDDAGICNMAKKLIRKRGKGTENMAMRVFYALAIIFVVAGHSMSDGTPAGPNLLYNFFPVYSFHMPMLIFGAGYFSPRVDDSILEYAVKRAKRLLIPLYALNLLFGILTEWLLANGYQYGEHLTFYTLVISPWTDGHQFALGQPLWFVTMLYILQITDFSLRKWLINFDDRFSDTILTIAYGFLSIICMNEYGASNNDPGGVLLLIRVVSLIPFYSLGRLYKEQLEQYDTMPNWVYFPAIMLIQASLMFLSGNGSAHSVYSWGYFPNGYLTIPFALTGTLFWLRVSKIIGRGIGKEDILVKIGKSTFTIMYSHLPISLIVNYVQLLMHDAGNKFFNTFSETAMKASIWYRWAPSTLTNGYEQAVYTTIYVIAGVLIPVFAKETLARAAGKMRRNGTTPNALEASE